MCRRVSIQLKIQWARVRIQVNMAAQAINQGLDTDWNTAVYVTKKKQPLF